MTQRTGSMRIRTATAPFRRGITRFATDWMLCWHVMVMCMMAVFSVLYMKIQIQLHCFAILVWNACCFRICCTSHRSRCGTDLSRCQHPSPFCPLRSASRASHTFDAAISATSATSMQGANRNPSLPDFAKHSQMIHSVINRKNSSKRAKIAFFPAFLCRKQNDKKMRRFAAK